MKLPDDCVNAYTFLGLMLSVVREALSAECPPDAPEKAMQCVAILTGTTRQTGESLLSNWDLQKIGEACDEGKFDQSIRCAERIINSCKDHTEQGPYLSKYLDIPLMKQGVTRLCTETITDLHSKSECIRRQKPFVKTCAKAEFTEFRHKVNQLEGDLDRIRDEACKLMHRVYECQKNSVRTNCGEAPARELSKILSYFVPPYCAKTDISGPGNGGANVTYFRTYIAIICIVATVLNAPRTS